MFSIAWYELLQVSRRKSVMVIYFGLPLLLIFILGSALSTQFVEQDRVLKPVKVTIWNADQGLLGMSFDEYMRTPEVMKYVEPVFVTSREQVIAQVKSKEAKYGVFVQETFSTKVIQGEAAEWEFFSGSNALDNVTARTVLQSYLDQVNADQAATVVLGPQENRTQDNVQSPDAVTIGSLKETGQPYSAVQYYSTSMLIMFLLFSGMSMSISLLQERETHTLARLHSLPLSFNQILVGKLLGNMLISLVQAVIIVCFTAWVYKVDWGNHLLLVFIVCVLTIIASMCIGILLATMVKSSKSVNTLHSSIITAMTFLSGGMFPYLGETLEKLGHFTVNYWAYKSLLRLMSDSSLSDLYPYFSVLSFICLGLLIFTLLRYRRAGLYE